MSGRKVLFADETRESMSLKVAHSATCDNTFRKH